MLKFNNIPFFIFTFMLLQKFQTNLKQNFPCLSTVNCQLLVAVSGGIDSVVLVNLLHKSGFPFSIAHCNFQLRGNESERDEAFVTALAKQYDKPLFIKKFDTKKYAAKNKLSIQEAARKLRYDWFAEIVDGCKMSDVRSLHPSVNSQLSTVISSINQLSAINLIATAHHANDNIETLLINFFRGTGISGLHGILPKQNNIIRPLLFAKREEIERYAKENELHWVEDSSNASDKYTRNFFRHQLLPLVKEAFANAENNLLQNIHRFSEAEILYNQAIELHKKKLLETKGNEVHIPVLKLQKAEPLSTIIREIVKDFSFTSSQVNDIKSLLTSENGKYVASASHRIIRNRAWLIIAPLQNEESQHVLIEEKDKLIFYEDGELLFTQLSAVSRQSSALPPTANYQLPTDKNTATLDAKHIQYPLLLRKWKPGDYFYPLGMKKKKKLSKFFIDIKLSKTEKEKVWVLEMNKKIIWIIGYRIDNRFKITNTTKEIRIVKAAPNP